MNKPEIIIDDFLKELRDLDDSSSKKGQEKK